MDIESKVVAIQGVHFGNIVLDKQVKWKSLAEYWCVIPFRESLPLKKSVPHSDAWPEFYNSVLKTYNKIPKRCPRLDKS